MPHLDGPMLHQARIAMRALVAGAGECDVGENVDSKIARVVDLYQKATALDPETVWIMSEQIITNQKNTVVCIVRNTLINYNSQAVNS